MSTGLIAGGSLAGIIIALLVVFEEFGKKIDFSIPASAGGEPGYLVPAIAAFSAMAAALFAVAMLGKRPVADSTRRSRQGRVRRHRPPGRTTEHGATALSAAYGRSESLRHVIGLLMALSALAIGIDPRRAPALHLAQPRDRGRSRGGRLAGSQRHGPATRLDLGCAGSALSAVAQLVALTEPLSSRPAHRRPADLSLCAAHPGGARLGAQRPHAR